MYKFVSFFGEPSPLFDELNKKAEVYARSRGLDYVWAPQTPYNVSEVIDYMNASDGALIDVEPYDDRIFDELTGRCRLLVRFGVGFDKVDLEAATKHGLCVTRTTGANKTGVAEMALTMLLAAGRQLMVNRATVNSGVWVKNIGSELIGKKVGILGFGNIGIALARLLSGFGCELVAYDLYPDEAAARELNVRFTDLEEIFTTCDRISVHLPYTRETHHLINKETLEKMKPDAVLVCTARGNIIDEDALYEVLKNHKIGGAGLDVYGTEPLPKTSKLTELDNIILTPHVASQTVESLWNTYKKAIDIAADFFEGRTIDKADLLNPEYVNA